MYLIISCFLYPRATNGRPYKLVRQCTNPLRIVSAPPSLRRGVSAADGVVVLSHAPLTRRGANGPTSTHPCHPEHREGSQTYDLSLHRPLLLRFFVPLRSTHNDKHRHLSNTLQTTHHSPVGADIIRPFFHPPLSPGEQCSPLQNGAPLTDILHSLSSSALIKPPLSKGRWHSEAVTEGIVSPSSSARPYKAVRHSSLLHLSLSYRAEPATKDLKHTVHPNSVRSF